MSIVAMYFVQRTSADLNFELVEKVRKFLYRILHCSMPVFLNFVSNALMLLKIWNLLKPFGIMVRTMLLIPCTGV